MQRGDSAAKHRDSLDGPLWFSCRYCSNSQSWAGSGHSDNDGRGIEVAVVKERGLVDEGGMLTKHKGSIIGAVGDVGIEAEVQRSQVEAMES